MTEDSSPSIETLIDRYTVAVEVEHELDIAPRWVWAARSVAAYQVLWGAWMTLLLRPSSSASYDLMEAAASIRMQGVLMLAVGVLVSGVFRRARRGSLWRIVGGSLMGACWGYVLGAMTMANPTTTAVPTYACVAGLCVWIVWRAVEDRHG